MDCINLIELLYITEELKYCHLFDQIDDKNHSCLDYMECEECPYYYADEF